MEARMTEACRQFVDEIRSALGAMWTPAVDVVGTGALPSLYAVTDLAAATVGVALAEVAGYAGDAFERAQVDAVRVDQRLASFWFQGTIKPAGWRLPPVWDALAGDYEGNNGWIRLHTNAPHHRAAALRVLGCQGQRELVEAAVARWSVEALEAAVVAAGGCAAAMRSEAAWLAHQNGAAVSNEPLVDQTMSGIGPPPRPGPAIERPLAGIRVLDLTRVLAGPVCTRFLAGWGADVLRLDPVEWEEGIVIPEVALGKRCARMNLKTAPGRAALARLLSTADVLVHGYRPDALDGLGFGAEQRQQLRPGLIDVSLDAYGWTGPWAGRRGFDSLVQMSCGIAHAGMHATAADKPFPLPVQALDHATGYLMAAATVRALRNRLEGGEGTRAKCSLARTARLLMTGPPGDLDAKINAPLAGDWMPQVEATSWGPARRLRPPGGAPGLELSWGIPAGELGRHSASWQTRAES